MTDENAAENSIPNEPETNSASAPVAPPEIPPSVAQPAETGTPSFTLSAADPLSLDALKHYAYILSGYEQHAETAMNVQAAAESFEKWQADNAQG